MKIVGAEEVESPRVEGTEAAGIMTEGKLGR